MGGAGAAILFLAGCATSTINEVVGPNPKAVPSTGTDGTLEVYSALSGHTEGSNPAWYRYSNYTIWDENEDWLERVDNAQGHYSTTPALVNLPPGYYLVEGRAKNGVLMKVPVQIKIGEITSVYLNGHWQPPTNTPPAKLVSAPGDYSVGWRVSPGT